MAKVTNTNFKMMLLGIYPTEDELAVMTDLEKIGMETSRVNAWTKEEAEKRQFIGTEKQINWVKSIYRNILYKTFMFTDYAIFADAFAKLLTAPNDCKWWIDHRDMSASNIFRDELRPIDEALYKIEEEYTHSEAIKMLYDRATKILQEARETKTTEVKEETKDEINVVKVIVTDNTALFYYKKDEKFVDVMHECHCKWDMNQTRWYRKPYFLYHTVKDIAAEVANTLIENGFEVEFNDDEVREKCENKSWTSEYAAKLQYYAAQKVLREQADAKEAERVKKLTVAIKYKDFKNNVWYGKIEKALIDSYDHIAKTINVVAKNEAYANEIKAYYDKKSKKEMPAALKAFKEGYTDKFEVVPETIDPDSLEIDVPWELKNE